MNKYLNYFEPLIIVLFFVVYFSSYLINGEDSFIRIHDNLDQSNLAGIYDGYFQGSFFKKENLIDFYFPTLDQQFKLSVISFDKILFYLFGYFWGFVINELIIRVIGFIGIILLIDTFQKSKKLPNVFKILMAISFCSLPFWPQGNISISGLPLLLASFINLFKVKNIIMFSSYIFFFGFYSSFVTSGLFVGIIIIPAFIYFLFVGKLNYNLFQGALLLLISYIISHYNLFFIYFFSELSLQGTETTRLTIAKSTNALDSFINLFRNNHSHTITNHGYIILPSIFVLLVEKFKFSKMKKWIIILCLYIIFSCFVYGLSFFVPFVEWFDFLSGFRWNRFFWLSPPAWYLLWFILLLELNDKTNFNFLFLFIILYLFVPETPAAVTVPPIPKSIIVLILFFILFLIKLNHKYVLTSKASNLVIFSLLLIQITINTLSYLNINRRPSFKDFYSKNQFKEIIRTLNIDKKMDRIGCIGFYPSVANYNGLKTIGAYSPMYDSYFKDQFYKIIKDEISKNKFLYEYFTNWGSRVYLFDDEIGKPYYDQQYRINRFNPEISTKLNVRELKKMGINFLFSVSKITNDKEKGLELVLESKKDEYFYTLYVYRID